MADLWAFFNIFEEGPGLCLSPDLRDHRKDFLHNWYKVRHVPGNDASHFGILKNIQDGRLTTIFCFSLYFLYMNYACGLRSQRLFEGSVSYLAST